MPTIETYDSDEYIIKFLHEEDLVSPDDYDGLGNTYNTVSDFVENGFSVIQVVNKAGKRIFNIGEFMKPGWFDFPSSGGDTVALVIENDTMEGIMDFAEQIVWYAPEELHWYRINGKLICELWWD